MYTMYTPIVVELEQSYRQQELEQEAAQARLRIEARRGRKRSLPRCLGGRRARRPQPEPLRLPRRAPPRPRDAA